MQQSLALCLKPEYTFASFHVGNNRLVVNSLQRLQRSDAIYLWAQAGLGVSHLLQACCEAAQQQGQQAIYLDLNAHAQYSPELFDGLEHVDVIIIDHLDAIAGLEAWEKALFHFYNRCTTQPACLLIGSHQPPQMLSLQLADLTSRLKSMLVLQLKALGDADKIAALQARAKQLGLDLPLEVGQFLLTHAQRDLSDLMKCLLTLDQASLKAQRKLTIPFVKQVLTDTHDLSLLTRLL